MENLQTYPKLQKRPYTNAEYIIYKKNTLDEKPKNPVYFLGIWGTKKNKGLALTSIFLYLYQRHSDRLIDIKCNPLYNTKISNQKQKRSTRILLNTT